MSKDNKNKKKVNNEYKKEDKVNINIINKEKSTSKTEVAKKENKEQTEKIIELESKISELEKNLSESKNDLLRTIADTENLKKRLLKEKEDSVSFANTSIIKDLIPSLDSIDLALASITDENIKNGVLLIQTSLVNSLSKWGLSVIKENNVEYDPLLHEACLFETDENTEKEEVVEVLQNGYKLHSRVIRPAKVKVKKPQ